MGKSRAEKNVNNTALLVVLLFQGKQGLSTASMSSNNHSFGSVGGNQYRLSGLSILLFTSRTAAHKTSCPAERQFSWGRKTTLCLVQQS